MSVQKTISILLFVVGILLGMIILWQTWRSKDEFAAETGSIPLLCLLEAVIYFSATIGISDFLLNTLVIRHFRLTDNRKLPGTLVAATITPGAVIAFFLLRVDNPVRLQTLLPCSLSFAAGCAVGSRLVGKMDGKKIRTILGYALIISMGVLVLRIVISRGAAGTGTGLSLPVLFPAVILVFLFAAVNMLGVPVKPACTALFLLLGLSPLSTLTLVLVMCCVGPVAGAAPIIMEDRYHHRLACSAVLFGTAGAVLGSLFTITVSGVLLNILLMFVLLVAIISIFTGE